MGRGQTFDYRPICTRDAAIVVTCPKCKCCAIFVKATVPHIDMCGFESHSFRCACCASLLAGIIDPIDGARVLNLLDEPSGVTIPLGNPLSGQRDPQCDTRLHDAGVQRSN
jgi:hypothetical protein